MRLAGEQLAVTVEPEAPAGVDAVQLFSTYKAARGCAGMLHLAKGPVCDGSGLGNPLRFESHMYVRKHGDGFVVSVEPHPIGDSLNRRCASYPAALSRARGTHQRKGWIIVDEARAERAAVHHGSRHECGRGKVHLRELAYGSWIGSVSPRPWGWKDATRQFLCFVNASSYADDLRHRLKLDELKRQQRRARNKESR